MPFVRTLDSGAVLLRLHVQPRARQQGVAGIHGDALKLKLTVPPVDGRANRELINFLARTLRLAKHDVVIRRGQQSRHKQVLLQGISADRVRELLTSAPRKGKRKA